VSLRRLFLLAALVVLAVPGPATAGSVTDLSLTGFSDMVVDSAHAQVFVTGGSGNASVVVLNYSGAVVATITSQPGAAGMALDPATGTVYVALSNSNGISAIDTETLTETGRISLAPASAPTHLALAGGRLWFAHDCSGTTSNFGSIATDGSDLQQYNRGGDYPIGCPRLATSPADGNVLVASAVGSSPPTVFVYDASSNIPSVTTSKSLGTSDDFEDMAVTPDGSKLIAAAGYPYFLQVFSLSDLSSVGSYVTGAYPVAVAITASGAFVAGGKDAASGGPIDVFNASTSALVRSFSFAPASSAVRYAGLAFSPDASKIFAVSDGGTTGVSFRVYGSPTVPPAPTTTSLSTSASTVAYNHAVTLSAHLSGASGSVSIYATPYGGAKTLVKRAAVNGSGNVSASYVLKRRTTFTAEYAGDDAHAASTSAGKVVKVRALAALALTGNYGTSGKYRLYHVRRKAYLRGSVAPNHAGLPLKFVVQLQISGTWRTMASNSFPMQSNGSAYAYFYANFRGSFRTRCTFGDDADHLGDTSPWRYFRFTA
jgi:YVTN family beta-propeller protein